MMRGRKTRVTAVRRPSGGLALDIQPLPTIYSGRMRRTPLIRGIIVLIEAMVLGIKRVVSLTFAVALFFMAPLFLTKLLDPYINSSLVFHLIEGFIRLAIFIAYLKLMTLVPDIKRVFAYHGAEHKAVNAYEAGVPLEVGCGTSFLFVVLIIAIVVFALVGRPAVWLMVLSRIVLIPVIAALGYEVIYFGANHIKNGFVRAILAPGLWLQTLTTREPDDSQLDVALAALKKVVEVDQLEEAAQAPSG